jgi:hypothetical protein
VNDPEDPGWGVPLRSIVRSAVPFVGLLSARRRRSRRDPLTVMRSLILSEVASLFLFLIAFSFIAHWDGGDEGWVPSGVIAVGGLAMIGIAWVRRRPVRGTTQASLVNVYRTQFFLSIGLAMIPALTSLAGVLITRSLWIYLIGLAFSLVGLAWIAPTRRDIERRQAELTASGSPLSLLDALLTTPPGRPPEGSDGTK